MTSRWPRFAGRDWRARVTFRHPSQGPSGERADGARRGQSPFRLFRHRAAKWRMSPGAPPVPPKAQPARKRSGKGTAVPDGLWRAARRGAHRRGAVPVLRRPISQVTGQRGGGPGRPAASFLFRLREFAMGLRTALYETHTAGGARMVDFGGWDMPVNYGSQIEEHHGVRRDAGMFDVSHMCVVDLRGARRARLPAPPARERRRQADPARQGALLLHAARAWRRSSTT